MLTQIYTCDHCAERITSDRSSLEASCGPIRKSRESIDLCSTCAAEFLETLTAMPSTAEVRRQRDDPDQAHLASNSNGEKNNELAW